jgi:lysophospholipase L1-like esterase
VLRMASRMLVSALLLAGCASPGPSTSPPAEPSPTSGAPSAPPSSLSAATPSGSAAAGLHLIVLGDSIPYGQQDCGGCTAFPALFGQWIGQATGVPVVVDNLSRHDSYTAARMAADLPGSVAAQSVAGADVVVVTIGHNDTPWNAVDDACDADHGPLDGYSGATWDVYQGECVATEVDRFRANLETILSTIVDLRGGRRTALRLTTQYNDLLADPGIPATGKMLSIAVKDAYNAAACEVASEHGFVCVDVYHAFNGPAGDMSAGDLESAVDFTHPSAKGQQLIATLLEEDGLTPLQ